MGSFLARKRRIQGCPNWRCGHRGARSGGILCDWLGRHIWPSPIGPKLEGGHTGGKLSVTSSHGSQPSHLVRIATGVGGFLPELMVVHCGSEFCFIYGLVIAICMLTITQNSSPSIFLLAIQPCPYFSQNNPVSQSPQCVKYAFP